MKYGPFNIVFSFEKVSKQIFKKTVHIQYIQAFRCFNSTSPVNTPIQLI